MTDQIDLVEHLVQMAREAFEVAVRRVRLNSGDTLTVPVQLPSSDGASLIEEVLRRLSSEGFSAAYTTGVSSITITRTNMPASSGGSDSETLKEIRDLIAQMIELQAQILQRQSGINRPEVIAALSFLWAIVYGVVQLAAR